MTRIHAGHAYTHNKFALCIGKLEDDDPSSCLLIYDETFEGLWGFVDVPRILLSVTSFPSETRDKTIYVTMSDEGDVYFIEGDVPVEKIPGAGVRSDDAEDLGPMNRIICDDGLLFACGMGSQVYRRDRGGAGRGSENADATGWTIPTSTRSRRFRVGPCWPSAAIRRSSTAFQLPKNSAASTPPRRQATRICATGCGPRRRPSNSPQPGDSSSTTAGVGNGWSWIPTST